MPCSKATWISVPTIGWKSDIEHVPIGKLRDFYDTFYWPNNATVTVVGDIEPAATLALIVEQTLKRNIFEPAGVAPIKPDRPRVDNCA